MSEMIRLYTIQHIEVLEKVLKKGTYSPITKYIYDESFVNAYNWLYQASRKKNKNWKSKRPIWCWTKRPDLRSYRYIRDSRLNNRKQKMVLLELKIPKKNIVLTDFEKWHFILNELYLPNKFYNEKEFYSFYKKYEKNGKLSKKGFHLMTKSWLNCFKLEPKSVIQATIPKINKKDIVSYKVFESINLSVSK